MSCPARVGQVARETGLSIDTIRFYEKQGLLKRSARTEGGFRLFGAGDIEALKFVRGAQQLGFSLSEIRELLILRAEHMPACSHVKDLLEEKLAAVARNRRVADAGAKPEGRPEEMQKSSEDGIARHEQGCPVLDEICPAASSNLKRWPESPFAAVADWAIEKADTAWRSSGATLMKAWQPCGG